MCGICGEFSWKTDFILDIAVKKMVSALARRGPDDHGIWAQNNIALGHTRLSIIDLSDLGHQPMARDGFVLVFNGCIYNYVELRKELLQLGFSFRSSSDTEVLLNAYKCWGESCVKRFDGMFAFAIWDSHKKELFLARDRLGKKPLYFTLGDQSIKFASTIQALLASGNIDTSLDKEGLQLHFTLHSSVPAPYTIIKAIRKLEPGYTMRISSQGSIIKKRYWDLDLDKKGFGQLSDESWIKVIEEQLYKSIEKRVLATDVEAGILLSGGIDSSIIVAIMDKLGFSDIRTFSIGFESDTLEQGDEFFYSDLVSKHFKTKHKKFTIRNQEVLPNLIHAVESMSEPMVSQDAVAFYMLSERVARDVKVVLSGQGADELFGGYPWYEKMYTASLSIDTSDPESVLKAFEPYYFDRNHEEYLQMMKEDFAVRDITSEFIRNKLLEFRDKDFIERVLRLDLTTLIIDDPVKRVDNMTMAWGLESRVPFLDFKLLETVTQSPSHLKVKNGVKTILKNIAEDLLPKEIVHRKKVGFPLPALKYIKGDFLEYIKDILYSQKSLKRNLYNRDYVDSLIKNLKAPESFTRIQGSKLWHLALLELWLQVNVDPYAGH